MHRQSCLARLWVYHNPNRSLHMNRFALSIAAAATALSFANAAFSGDQSSTRQALPCRAMMSSPISPCHKIQLAKPTPHRSRATSPSPQSTMAQHSPSPPRQTAICSQPTPQNMHPNMTATALMALQRAAKYQVIRHSGASLMTNSFSTSLRML